MKESRWKHQAKRVSIKEWFCRQQPCRVVFQVQFIPRGQSINVPNSFMSVARLYRTIINAIRHDSIRPEAPPGVIQTPPIGNFLSGLSERRSFRDFKSSKPEIIGPWHKPRPSHRLIISIWSYAPCCDHRTTTEPSRMAYKTSCLCGELEFEASGEPIFTTFRHYKLCGIFFDKAVFPPGTLLYASSEPVSDDHADSMKHVEQYFCFVCGSTVNIRNDEMVVYFNLFLSWFRLGLRRFGLDRLPQIQIVIGSGLNLPLMCGLERSRNRYSIQTRK